MPVFKNKTQGQYVNVYKDILKNHSLSLRDRGMVVTLLSLPDNWEFTISGLSKIIKLYLNMYNKGVRTFFWTNYPLMSATDYVAISPSFIRY